jgi:hypothetical protein
LRPGRKNNDNITPESDRSDVYGGILLLPAISYFLLQTAIVRNDAGASLLAHALGKDLKGKISLGLYTAGVAIALFRPWLSVGIYVLVAVIWLVPDRRIERAVRDMPEEN